MKLQGRLAHARRPFLLDNCKPFDFIQNASVSTFALDFMVLLTVKAFCRFRFN